MTKEVKKTELQKAKEQIVELTKERDQLKQVVANGQNQLNAIGQQQQGLVQTINLLKSSLETMSRLSNKVESLESELKVKGEQKDGI